MLPVRALRIYKLPNYEVDQRSLEEVLETPFENGFSKPLPKLFGFPLLHNGSRYLVMVLPDAIIAKFGRLSLSAPSRNRKHA